MADDRPSLGAVPGVAVRPEETAAPPLPTLRLDTLDYPPSEGLRLWQACMPEYEVTPDGPVEEFAAAIDATLLGMVAISHGRVSPVRLTRTAERLAADGADSVSLMLVLEGSLSGVVGGRALTAGPGTVAVFDLRRPIAVLTQDLAFITLTVARQVLADADGAMPDHHGQAEDGATTRLLVDHVQALARHLPVITVADAPAIARGTAAVIAACLARPRPVDAAPLLHGLQFAARRHIDERLDQDLTPTELCRAMRCSRSVLYRAFRSLGGVAAYIRDRRLDAAYALLLQEPPQRVGAIADRLRFPDTASFAKAFRRRFGQPPREVRNGTPGARRQGADVRAVFEHWSTALAGQTAGRSANSSGTPGP